MAGLGRWTLEIVKRPNAAEGFVILPRRWVVERRPDLLFSLRTVLRREHPTWLGAVIAIVDIGTDAFGIEHEGPISGGGLPAIGLAVVVYLVLRLLSRSRTLRVAGR